MSRRKKSSATIWNAFTSLTDTLLLWNKCSCSNKKHSCYLPRLTDNKVKLQESHWLRGLKVALPHEADTGSPTLIVADWYQHEETICSLFGCTSDCSFLGMNLWFYSSQSVTRTNCHVCWFVTSTVVVAAVYWYYLCHAYMSLINSSKIEKLQLPNTDTIFSMCPWL